MLNETKKTMTKVFEVKIANKWSKVRASSIMALNSWGKKNGVTDWRMLGMMSTSNINKSKNLKIVA